MGTCGTGFFTSVAVVHILAVAISVGALPIICVLIKPTSRAHSRLSSSVSGRLFRSPELRFLQIGRGVIVGCFSLSCSSIEVSMTPRFTILIPHFLLFPRSPDRGGLRTQTTAQKRSQIQLYRCARAQRAISQRVRYRSAQAGCCVSAPRDLHAS